MASTINKSIKSVLFDQMAPTLGDQALLFMQTLSRQPHWTSRPHQAARFFNQLLRCGKRSMKHLKSKIPKTYWAEWRQQKQNYKSN